MRCHSAALFDETEHGMWQTADDNQAIAIDDAHVQHLVDACRAGESGALDDLVPAVYADLRRIARHHVRQWGLATVDTTGLVHEAYLKLAGQDAVPADDRAHFLAICARAMRQFIVSYARRRDADKRGSGQRTQSLDDVVDAVAADAEQLMLIDQALARLAAIDERLVRVFECRFFAELSDEETARALGRPLRSVQRDWMRARAWVAEMLRPEAEDVIAIATPQQRNAS